MEATVKPQKRNENLVPLSREHHFGLLFGWKIKQGLANKTDLKTIRNYVLYFWQQNLKQHFETEETLLAKVAPESDEMFGRMLKEHELIREMILQMEKREDVSALLFEALHLLVTDHIRFEERKLFPHLEQLATPGQLVTIGEVLHHDHAEPADDFSPAFWEKKRS